MPVPVIAAYAKRYGLSPSKVEGFWNEAKKEYGKNWAAASGTTRAMCENASAGRKKAMKK